MAGGSNQKKNIRGTREWAVAEINCCLGCLHGCRYCYARYDAVQRKGIVTEKQWNACRVVEKEVLRQHPLYSGQVMFPTAHDIVPDNLEACVKVLKNLLDAGNRVLVVSKPNIESVRRICMDFDQFRERLLFRFTITARDSRLLEFWEPGAPAYTERKACLRHAFDMGFATSVSVEPMLDTGDVIKMVHELLPYISHSIWLGKMNRIDERVNIDSEQMSLEIERIKQGQRDEKIWALYRDLKLFDKVRWKESVKEVLGLEGASKPGLDI